MAAADDGDVMDTINRGCWQCGNSFASDLYAEQSGRRFCGRHCAAAWNGLTPDETAIVKAYDAVPHIDATDRVAAAFDVTREAVIAAVRKSIERGGE